MTGSSAVALSSACCSGMKQQPHDAYALLYAEQPHGCTTTAAAAAAVPSMYPHLICRLIVDTRQLGPLRVLLPRTVLRDLLTGHGGDQLVRVRVVVDPPSGQRLLAPDAAVSCSIKGGGEREGGRKG